MPAPQRWMPFLGCPSKLLCAVDPLLLRRINEGERLPLPFAGSQASRLDMRGAALLAPARKRQQHGQASSPGELRPKPMTNQLITIHSAATLRVFARSLRVFVPLTERNHLSIGTPTKLPQGLRLHNPPPCRQPVTSARTGTVLTMGFDAVCGLMCKAFQTNKQNQKN